MLGSYPCVFVNLTKARGSWEEGLSVEEMPPPNWTAEKPAGIFLTSDKARGRKAGYFLRSARQSYGHREGICDTRGLQIADWYCYYLRGLHFSH